MSIQKTCNTLMCYKEYFSEHSDMDLDAFLGFILNNVVMIYISADSFHRVTHWIFQGSKGYNNLIHGTTESNVC